jgi:protocatechuate 3,4-dioxygenase beta subunit
MATANGNGQESDLRHQEGRNERIAQIWTRAVEVLRDLVAELDITEDELHEASHFFDQMGVEHNFHTLLDATLSTASNEHLYRSRGVVASNVEGPVYQRGAPYRPDGVLTERPLRPEDVPLVVSGRVYDIATGNGVAGAELDVWQADAAGLYDRKGFHLRGIVRTDDEGRYVIRTVLPADYESHKDDTITQLYAWIGRGTLRAAHVHFKVYLNGVHLLTTQVFRSDSPNLDDDLVIGIVRPELIAPVTPPPPGSDEPWTMPFDIPVNVALAAGADRGAFAAQR